MNPEIKRRAFLKNTVAAGLTAPLIASTASANPWAAARPVVISSSNNHMGADGKPLNGGINCVNKAMEILKAGGDTLDAVLAGVEFVENDPNDDSVGYGGLPNEECEVELDSSVMHGPSKRAGAVANLKHIKNPSKVARVVLENTDHILIVGEGALKFAHQTGLQTGRFIDGKSRKLLVEMARRLNDKDNWGPSWHKTARTKKVAQVEAKPQEIAWNNYAEERLRNRPTGTINCLAVDANGDISGVTTTSGLAWKIPGRVGDSPLIGCGLYVDNEIGAAGSTGTRRRMIYINGAHTVVEKMRHGMSPTDAAMDAIKRVCARYGNNLEELASISLNFYAVNKKGEYGGACIWKGGQFTVHDGTVRKLVDSVHLFEQKK